MRPSSSLDQVARSASFLDALWAVEVSLYSAALLLAVRLLCS